MAYKPKIKFILGNRRWLGVSLLGGIALVAAMIIALTACQAQPAGSYQTPPVTGDGWSTAPLSEAGMDEKPINELLDLLRNKTGYISMVVFP